MTLPANRIIDIIFVAIFVALLPFTLFNLYKHSLQKKAAYLFLILFNLVRIVGNALLVAGFESEKGVNVNVNNVTNLFIAGYIMQGLGYGFLLSSSFSFYNRAIGYDKKEEKVREKMTGKKAAFHPSRVLHVINLVATILLIVGLSNSPNALSLTGGGISILAKVGGYLYCAVTALIMVLTVYHLFIQGPITNASRIILTFVLMATIPMAMRAGYSAYRYQTNSLANYNVWLHLVFQDIVEAIAVMTYIALGFYLHAKGGDGELDERRHAINDVEQHDMNDAEQGASTDKDYTPAHEM